MLSWEVEKKEGKEEIMDPSLWILPTAVMDPSARARSRRVGSGSRSPGTKEFSTILNPTKFAIVIYLEFLCREGDLISSDTKADVREMLKHVFVVPYQHKIFDDFIRLEVAPARIAAKAHLDDKNPTPEDEFRFIVRSLDIVNPSLYLRQYVESIEPVWTFDQS